MIRLVNQIIARAVETQASDIHIEPFEDRLRVRYRYDGVLHEADSPPPRLTAAIISRIKIMAQARHRRAPAAAGRPHPAGGARPGGRFPRLHRAVAAWRERGAARARPQRGRVRFRAASACRRPVVEQFSAALDLPNGIVLVTGPTGSGKTTTLYTGAAGAERGRPARSSRSRTRSNISCAASTRSRCEPQIGLTFADLLRSILRQDPDVIMVGEIRDLETAQIAVQAALTGHLVLSTLHTNSAAAAITRLRDMGLEDYLLTAVLRGVLAQRLVRRLCTACRRAAPAPPELVRALRSRAPRRRRPGHAVASRRLPGSAGRPAIAARQAIAEFLVPDAGDRAADLRRAPTMPRSSGRRSAAAWRPMFEAGLAARWPARRRSRKSCAASGPTSLMPMAALPLHGDQRRAASIERGRDGGGQRSRGDRAAAAQGHHADARRAGAARAPGPLACCARSSAAAAGCAGRKSPISTRELATMLGAGQDLDRALRFLIETAPSPRVRRGARPRCATRCATAARLPRRSRSTRRAFRALYVGLVRAGEAGGQLAATLERLADLLDAPAQAFGDRDLGADLSRRCWSWPPSARSRCC